MFYTDEQINSFLIEKFNQYQTNYILKIINELRKLNILTLHNSIEGWNNFVYNYITKIIKETIEKQTLLSKQRLSFMKYYSKNYTDFDIPQFICEKINSQLIIHTIDEL
tara:strand:- start:39 stop:365 length:327 start_codon:yes stop_codon:yes gene_type:complete